MKVELDHMLEAGIIEPVEESEWISPIVIQDKKETSGVMICVDLRKLNNPAYMIHSQHHLQMKSWRASVDKKCTHSQTDYRATMKSELRKRTATRQPL